jgi:hypothetical protein
MIIRIPRRIGLIAVLSLIAAGAVTAATASGYTAGSLVLLTGQAWLPSSVTGEVSLVDGASGQVAGSATVVPPRHLMSVGTVGHDAVIGDVSTGQVFWLNGGSQKVTEVPVKWQSEGGDTRVLAAGRHAYVVRGHQFVMVDAAPGDDGLQVNQLDPSVDPATITTDAAGRLLALNQEGQLLRPSDDGFRPGPAVITPGSASRLVVVAGQVVGVDPDQHTVHVVGGGSQRAVSCPHLSGRVEAAIPTPGKRRVLVVSTGAPDLLVADLDSGECRGVPLPGQPRKVGTPVVVGDRAFVPEEQTGRVSVVDLAAQSSAKTWEIGNGVRQLSLVAQDGFAFYYDQPRGLAGVFGAGGKPVAARHYMPVRGPGASIPPSNGFDDGAPTSPPASAVRLAVRLTASAVAGQDVGLVVRSDGRQLSMASWDFGDGKPGGSGIAVAHRWARAGRYLVHVEAYTSDGARGTFTASVTVASPGQSPKPSQPHTRHVEVSPTTTRSRDSRTSPPPPRMVRVGLTVVGKGTLSLQPAPVTGASSCDSSCTVTYQQGTSVNIFAPDRSSAGDDFAAWTGCPASGPSYGGHACQFVVSDSMDVGVVFTPHPQATVVLTSGAGGTLSMNGPGTSACTTASGATRCQLTIPLGDNVSFSASPDSGYHLIPPAGAQCSSTACTFTPGEAKTYDLTVAFERIRHQVTVTMVGGDGTGSVTGWTVEHTCSGRTCTAWFSDGQTLSLRAVSSSGSAFVQWNGCSSRFSTDGCMTVVHDTIDVSVTFGHWELFLDDLHCGDTNDNSGDDEAYVKWNGGTTWGPVKINNGQSRTVGSHGKLDGQVQIELWDSDSGERFTGGDDEIGSARVTWTSDRSSSFQLNGSDAHYSLSYRIVAVPN